MAHRIIETHNSTVFQEYNNNIFFQMEFFEDRVRVKTEETVFNPIERVRGNIKHFEFVKQRNKKLYEYGKF